MYSCSGKQFWRDVELWILETEIVTSCVPNIPKQYGFCFNLMSDVCTS